MDPSKNFPRRSNNFRQPNINHNREHENASGNSRGANYDQGQAGWVPNLNFQIPLYKMNKIRQALEVVFQNRVANSRYGNCLKCGLITTIKCTGCGSSYCSEGCQLSDWDRHEPECISIQESRSIATQNEYFQHNAEASHQGARNSFSNRQHFDNHTESTHMDHRDQRHQRHHRNFEGGQNRPPLNKNHARDNNRVPNGYQRDNGPSQKFNQQKRQGGRPRRDSNRSDSFQSNNVPNNAEGDNWHSPTSKPERCRMNEGFERQTHDASTKDPDQRQKKGNKTPYRNMENRNKNETSVECDWDKCENSGAAANNVEIKKEPVDDSSSSCKPQNLRAEDKETSPTLVVKTIKLEKPETRSVLGVTRDSDGSYYVCLASECEIFDTLHNSLQEESPKAKSVEPKIGLICACLAENEWFRGKIVSVAPEIKFVSLDFGPTWTCDNVKEPAKELPEQLAQGPGMARLLKFIEKLPSDCQGLNGKYFLVEVLEKSDEYDLVRFVKEIPYETVDENVESTPNAETVNENVENMPSAINLHLEEDNIKSGSLVIIVAFGISTGYVQRQDIPELQEVSDKIREYAKTSKPFQSGEALKIGDVVCARFTDDGNFYRAIIESKTEDKFNVRFVDYGNDQNETPLKDMLPLSEELKSYPQLAVKVNLKGVTTNDAMKRSKEYEELTEYLSDLSINSVQFILTYEDDIKNGVILKENATGSVLNEVIKNKLNTK